MGNGADADDGHRATTSYRTDCGPQNLDAADLRVDHVLSLSIRLRSASMPTASTLVSVLRPSVISRISPDGIRFIRIA